MITAVDQLNTIVQINALTDFAIDRFVVAEVPMKLPLTIYWLLWHQTSVSPSDAWRPILFTISIIQRSIIINYVCISYLKEELLSPETVTVSCAVILRAHPSSRRAISQDLGAKKYLQRRFNQYFSHGESLLIN